MPSPRPTFLLWTATLAIPVVFFLLLEGGLRLFGYGPDTSVFVRDDWKGTAYFRVNPGVALRYFDDDDHTTYVSRDRFLVDKPEGSYRIFCLGASTTIGFPYMFNAAFSERLANRLESLFPEKRVEVVNVGITAINSFAVLDLARDLVDYEPDLFLVYMGHNEFYGPFGPGSQHWGGMRPWMARTLLTLRKWRTVRLVEDVIGLFSPRTADPPQEGNLMERIVADPAIPLDGPAYRQALKAFEQNYRALADLAARHDVDMVVSTLAANLRDQPPFVSLSPENEPAPRVKEWKRAFEAGMALSEAGDCVGALERFMQATGMYDGHAETAFRKARCMEELGDSVQAVEAYGRARDLDGLKFRAPAAFNQVIHELARERRIPLADAERAFAEASSHRIPGNDLFWEHVHPRLEGYDLMAQTYLGVLSEAGLLQSADAWQRAIRSGEERASISTPVTPLDHEIARLRVAVLMNRWPFRAEPVPVEYTPSSSMEEAAWDYVRNRIGWAEAHKRLADRYAAENRHTEAAVEYLALAGMSPHDPFFYETAGDMLGRARRFSDAIGPFRKALRIERSPVTSAKLAIALYETGQLEEAIEQFQIALATEGVSGPPLSDGQRLQTTYLLGMAAVRAGDPQTALTQLERLQALNPGAPQVLRLRAAIEGRFRSDENHSD